MEQYEIHDAIISLLIWGLWWTNTRNCPEYTGIGNGKINQGMVQALEEQSNIGWNNVRQGFISSHWAATQYKVDKQ